MALLSLLPFWMLTDSWAKLAGFDHRCNHQHPMSASISCTNVSTDTTKRTMNKWTWMDDSEHERTTMNKTPMNPSQKRKISSGSRCKPTWRKSSNSTKLTDENEQWGSLDSRRREGVYLCLLAHMSTLTNCEWPGHYIFTALSSIIRAGPLYIIYIFTLFMYNISLIVAQLLPDFGPPKLD